MPFSSLQGLLIAIPAILVAITFHEYAHGKVANLLGDKTAEYQGRLTLNPLAHLDPVGTLLLVVAGFGWAKPVQVNPMQFRGDKKTGMMLVGIAGPLMNLVLAYLSAAALGLVAVANISGNLSFYLQQFFYLLLFYNVVLAIFNLLPVPPLDGSKILAWLLPNKFLGAIEFLDRYGFIILIILVMTNVTRTIIVAPVQAIVRLFLFLNGVGV